MRELDGGAAVQDAATQKAELLMQQELAEQRACEAVLEKQREFHGELGAALGVVQARYYELGAEVTRTEENIRHTTELRNRHRLDLAQTATTLVEVGAQIVTDNERVAQLTAEIAALAPELETLHAADQSGTSALAAAEAAFAGLAGALGEFQPRTRCGAGRGAGWKRRASSSWKARCCDCRRSPIASPSSTSR